MQNSGSWNAYTTKTEFDLISFLFIRKNNIIKNMTKKLKKDNILITFVFHRKAVVTPVRQSHKINSWHIFCWRPRFRIHRYVAVPFLILLYFALAEIPLKEFVGVFWRTWLVLLLPLLLAPLLFIASEPQVLPTAPAGASITVHCVRTGQKCALADREICPLFRAMKDALSFHAAKEKKVYQNCIGIRGHEMLPTCPGAKAVGCSQLTA